ncbi:PilW family protein [Variovorax robiniae]|uniref:PilW family protein n=1 Tax=Variovorax robiniae TaxID=1836199 RepID=A0ABU8XA10_9BURK
MSSRSALMRRGARRRQARGVTLVELLAALVIGLLVIGAAIAAMLLSRNSAAMVTDVARLHQQGSFAMRVIGMQARRAGSLDLVVPAAAGGMVSFNAEFTGLDGKGASVSGQEGEKGGPDKVSFTNQYIGPVKAAGISTAKAAEIPDAGVAVDPEQRDCVADSAINSRLQSTFWVEKGALKCTGLKSSQPLVADVADFQVWYRVKASPTKIRRMNADEVKAANLWRSVSSVEICLDLKGAETTSDQPSKTYVDCNGKEAPHNGVLHMLFRNVFDLRTQGAS